MFVLITLLVLHMFMMMQIIPFNSPTYFSFIACISRSAMIRLKRPKITEFYSFYSFHLVYVILLILLAFIVIMVNCSRYWKISSAEACCISDLFLVKDVELHQHKYWFKFFQVRASDRQQIFLLFVDRNKAQECVRISKSKFGCVLSRIIISNKVWIMHQV